MSQLMLGRLSRFAVLLAVPGVLLGLAGGLVAARADVLPTPTPLPSVVPPVAAPALPPSPSLPVSLPTPAPSAGLPTPLPSAPGVGAASQPSSQPSSQPPAGVAQPSPPRSTPSAVREAAPTSEPAGVSSVLGPVLAKPLSARVPLFPVLLPLLAGLLLLTVSAVVAAYRRTQEARRLREFEEAKTEFINLVSHELRTPLTVIRGYMAMIRDGDVSPGSQQFDRVLPILTTRVEQVAVLVEQMIDAARLESGDAELLVNNFDLRDVITDLMLAVHRPAGDKHVISYDLPAAPVPVAADRHRVTGILEQLIDNAIKYSPAGGEINLSVTINQTHAYVEVSDHGIGIAAADQAKLFTRFGRLVTPDNSQVLGAGLGLYLARETARRQGGDVTLRSRKGMGSTFTLSLPVVAGAPEPLAEAAPKPAIG